MATHFRGRVKFYPTYDYEMDDPSGMVGRYLRKRGEEILLAAKNQVGVDTGDLKKKLKLVHHRPKTGQWLWIGAWNPHALMHHEGTRPHVITARNSPYLRFTAGGRVIYTHSVMHPGTRPNRYLSDNLKYVRR